MRIIWLIPIILLITLCIKWWFPQEEMPAISVAPICICYIDVKEGDTYKRTSIYIDELRFDEEKEVWYVTKPSGMRYNLLDADFARGL